MTSKNSGKAAYHAAQGGGLIVLTISLPDTYKNCDSKADNSFAGFHKYFFVLVSFQRTVSAFSYLIMSFWQCPYVPAP